MEFGALRLTSPGATEIHAWRMLITWSTNLISQIVPQPAIDLLSKYGKLERNTTPERILSKSELIEALKRNEYLFCLLTDDIDAAVLDANPNLKIVANNWPSASITSTVAAATARKVAITNTPGVLTETTADTTWALLMSVARPHCGVRQLFSRREVQGLGPNASAGRRCVFGKTLGHTGHGPHRPGHRATSEGFRHGNTVLRSLPSNPGQGSRVWRGVCRPQLAAPSDPISSPFTPLMPRRLTIF